MMDVSLNSIKCVGIMNGTSLDGVDFVLVEIDKNNFSCQHLKTESFSFSKKLKSKIASAAKHQLFVDELALLHHELGRYYAHCYKKLDTDFKAAHLIGLHGQTVFHQGRVATLQIGEPSYLSAESNAIVISDFRAADIALGGQGAPIATYFHQNIFGQFFKKNQLISVHNLGGISNLSLIKNNELLLGFDTGPANMLIDMAIKISSKNKKNYDKNGTIARKGQPNTRLVEQMLKHPFFKVKPPKSCGREEFGEKFYKKYQKDLHKLNIFDRLSTLTDFVARSIATTYNKFCKEPPEEIIFCGGGANNVFLLEQIQHHLPDIRIKTTNDYGWPVQSIEGAAFAYLAAARALSIPSNLPKSTGATRATSLGKITKV